MVLLAVEFLNHFTHPRVRGRSIQILFRQTCPPFLPTSDTLGTPLATVPIVAGGKDNPAVTPNGDSPLTEYPAPLFLP
jgi:hypothetical protein